MKDVKIFTANDILLILDRIHMKFDEDKPFSALTLIHKYQEKFVKIRDNNSSEDKK
jgi:hypothetical protein